MATFPEGGSIKGNSRMPHSILLDGLRGFAALYVLAGHLLIAADILPKGKFDLPFRFGQEAVIVFFVLSGFVIERSHSARKDKSFSSYLKSRAFRIFPLYLLALFLAGLSHGFPHNPASPLWGNVLMLQDVGFVKPGVTIGTYAGNLALWSLSYEWWFYMGYFCILGLVPKQNSQAATVGCLSIFAAVIYLLHPNQVCLWLAYFTIWWGGVELARFRAGAGTTSKRHLLVNTFAICAVFLLFALETYLLKRGGRAIGFGLFPILMLRHFGMALLLVGFGTLATRSALTKANSLLAPLAFFAPFSYAIYVLQFPVVLSDYSLLGGRLPYLNLVLKVVILLVASAVLGSTLLNFVRPRLFKRKIDLRQPA